MLIENSPSIEAIWRIQMYRGDSRNPADLVEDFTKTNLVVTSGKNLLLDRLFNLGGAVALTGIQVGTNATAPAPGDTAITSSGITTPFKAFSSCSRSGLIVTAVSSFATTEGNGNLVECGILTAQNGVLFNRLTFGQLTKSTALSLDLTVTIQQS